MFTDNSCTIMFNSICFLSYPYKDSYKDGTFLHLICYKEKKKEFVTSVSLNVCFIKPQVEHIKYKNEENPIETPSRGNDEESITIRAPVASHLKSQSGHSKLRALSRGTLHVERILRLYPLEKSSRGSCKFLRAVSAA